MEMEYNVPTIEELQKEFPGVAEYTFSPKDWLDVRGDDARIITDLLTDDELIAAEKDPWAFNARWKCAELEEQRDPAEDEDEEDEDVPISKGQTDKSPPSMIWRFWFQAEMARRKLPPAAPFPVHRGLWQGECFVFRRKDLRNAAYLMEMVASGEPVHSMGLSTKS
jgi:hypothetical protein